MFRLPSGGVVFISLVLCLPLVVRVAPVQAGEKAVKVSCTNGFAGNYPCRKVGLQSRIPLKEFPGPPTSANDIWGYFDQNDGREYAIVGLSNGTAFIDVTNPQKPRIVGHIPGIRSFWRDIKVYSKHKPRRNRWIGYAYISTEARQGLQVVSLSKLPNSVRLVRTDRDIETAHNVFISHVDFATGAATPGLEPYLYVIATDKTGLQVFSLKKPKNPKPIGNYSSYVHDIYVHTIDDQRSSQCAPGHQPCEVVFAWTGIDFRIIDFTDKGSPHAIGNLQYPNTGFAHSGWISRNSKWIFGFDEVDESSTGANTRVLSINIKDLAHPRLVREWFGSTTAMDHNGFVSGNKLYIANSRRGLTILDATKPGRLKETGFFDTYPEDDSFKFAGAWGTYPFLPSGNILISDVNRGLFVVKEE